MDSSSRPAGTTAPAAPAPSTARSGSPESLDEVITTTKTHAWWALWAIAGAVVLAFIWSLVATIPQQVSGLGVVSSFDYISDLTSPVAGVVNAATVEPGGVVQKGQAVATIDPYDGGPDAVIAAPVDGTIHSVFVNEGQGVVAGTLLGQVVATPDPSAGIRIITYLPASAAIMFDVGQVVDVTFTDISSSQSATATATVESVANVPASIDSMAISSGSVSIANQWMDEAGGTPYRVAMNLGDWASTGLTQAPAPGAVVTVVNTYASLHPIELLFGGN